MRKAPPTRTSSSQTGIVNILGPNQRAICFGSVQACHTSARGTSKTRIMTTRRSFGNVVVSLAEIISLRLIAGVGLLQLADIELLHLQESFGDAVDLGLILVQQHVRQQRQGAIFCLAIGISSSY